jgi:hypothetical protein
MAERLTLSGHYTKVWQAPLNRLAPALGMTDIGFRKLCVCAPMSWCRRVGTGLAGRTGGRPLFPMLTGAKMKERGSPCWCSSCVIWPRKLHKSRECAGTVRGVKRAIYPEESTTWELPRIGGNASTQH